MDRKISECADAKIPENAANLAMIHTRLCRIRKKLRYGPGLGTWDVGDGASEAKTRSANPTRMAGDRSYVAILGALRLCAGQRPSFSLLVFMHLQGGLKTLGAAR